MKPLQIFAAASLALFAAYRANAGGLEPIHAQSIVLNGISGAAYYTVEENRFNVVSTFAHQGSDAAPIRIQALLASGECVSFSTPGAVNTAADSVEVCRQGDEVFFQKDRNLN